jgi:uroporphyrinogen-III synthase
LSSPTAATVLVERAQREPDWLRLPWCALGAGTARTLLALGIPANLIAASRNADHFATYALEHLPAEAPLLLPQSRRAGPRLAQRLRAAGRRVIAWDAYTVAPKPNLRWLGPPPPIVLFTSPSTAQAWIGAGLPSPALATWSMGESTTWELRQLGVEKVLEAPEPSPAGVRSLWETATRDSSHEP